MTPEQQERSRALQRAWKAANPERIARYRAQRIARRIRTVHPGIRLSKQIAERLRTGDLADLSAAVAAIRFGCKPNTIRALRRGETWRS